jgi:hypothetical protein
MNEKELRAILHSDMKLWDSAEEKDGERFIELPYGIGRVGVSLEGIDNGQKRAAAVGSFGEYIRGRVNDAIGDESVTARAKQDAAKASYDAGQLPVEQSNDSSPGRVGGVSDQVQEAANKEAMATPNELGVNPEGMALRAAWVRGTIEETAANLDALRRELEGLEAYLEIFNAPTHKKTPE